MATPLNPSLTATWEAMKATGQGGPLPRANLPERSQRSTAEPDPRALLIGIDALLPDPDQPRRTFTKESIDSLAESLRARGQLTAIRVRPMSPGQWWIVAGERRWRAARLAPLDALRAIEAPAGLTADDVLLDQLVENVQREELDAIEEAKAYQTLIARGEGQRALSRRTGIPLARIAQRLALLGLPPEVVAAVKDSQIPASTGYAISTAPPERQAEIAQAAIQGKQSRREVLAIVGEARGRPRGDRQREITTKAGIVIRCERSRPFTDAQLKAALTEAAGSIQLEATDASAAA